jgi:co-chaperonin GroES (HSP10)
MNETGIVPTEYKVLVELMEEQAQTKGGLFLPPSTLDKQEMAREIGIFKAAGAMAFNMNDPTSTPWPVYPKEGDHVYFDRYAGTIIKIKDGKKYRLLNDKNIAAIITTEIE